MAVLKVTSRGQVILGKEILLHLGVGPGDKIEVDLLPGRQASLTARPPAKFEDFFGLLAGKTKKVATIEEINEAAADGWAGLIEV